MGFDNQERQELACQFGLDREGINHIGLGGMCTKLEPVKITPMSIVNLHGVTIYFCN